jgi:hypothetical protein
VAKHLGIVAACVLSARPVVPLGCFVTHSKLMVGIDGCRVMVLSVQLVCVQTSRYRDVVDF